MLDSGLASLHGTYNLSHRKWPKSLAIYGPARPVILKATWNANAFVGAAMSAELSILFIQSSGTSAGLIGECKEGGVVLQYAYFFSIRLLFLAIVVGL